MKKKLIITFIFSCLIFSFLQAKDFKQIILKRRDIPIKRELVMDPESDGDLVYIDPYDGEAYLLDEDLFENCEKIVVRIL